MRAQQAVNQPAAAGLGIRLHAQLLPHDRCQTRRVGMVFVVNARGVQDGLAQRQPPPGRAQVYLVAFIDQLTSAQHLVRHEDDHLLNAAHHIMIVGVGLVELQLGELWVVLEADTLVAEVAADLVHPFEAADDEPLQIQLVGDAQIEVLMQLVMTGEERTSRRAAVDRLQNGGFHLQEAVVVQVSPQTAEDASAGNENLAHLGVGDQVQVSLAIASFHVL